MKNIQFNQLANNANISLEQYLYFKDSQKQYLDNKNITLEEINQIKKEYFSSQTYSKSNENPEYSVGLELLKVKSFYCNHNLFKLLNQDDKFKRIVDSFLHKKFNQKIYNQTYNELADIIDVEQLEKNLSLVNNRKFNYMVLQKALVNNDKKLYDFIEPLLNLNADRDEIMQSLCYVIENYGKRLKNTNLARNIKQHISIENFFKYEFHLDNKSNIENLNSFFDIDIKKYVVEKKLPPLSLKNLNFGDKQIESILYNVDKTQDNYFYIVYQYIKNEHSDKSISDKFKFLENENLLNEKIWKILLNPHITDFVKVVFAHNKVLNNILEKDKLKQANSNYVEYFFKQKRSIADIKEYIENCPNIIDRDNLVKIINNVYNPSNYKTHFDMKCLEYSINNYSDNKNFEQKVMTSVNYYETIEEELTQLLDVLYQKYPEHMKNKDTILDLASSSSNDILIGLYLEKYFTKNKDIELKQTVAKNLKVMTLVDFSRTLQWLVENNLVAQVINEKNSYSNIFSENYYNYLLPYLLDKCELNPNIVIRQTFNPQNDNNELFTFVLHNYEINDKTLREVCDIVHIQNREELAKEIFKANLVLSDKFVKQCQLIPNEAGNILLKSHLKQKLENKQLDNNLVKVKTKKI